MILLVRPRLSCRDFWTDVFTVALRLRSVIQSCSEKSKPKAGQVSEGQRKLLGEIDFSLKIQ